MTEFDKRNNGVFYTPGVLAVYLLSKCPVKNGVRVLDPACGEFALLNAAKRRFGSDMVVCVGCDKRHIKNRERNIRFVEKDFFEYRGRSKFDLIVENPPYIRGNKAGDSCKKWLASLPKGIDISKRADVWVYFLYKSVTHLLSEGSIAAILPWSFFQADYSKPIRQFLVKNFCEIKYQVLSKPFFADTPQKVVLIWMYGKGKRCTKITGCFSDVISADNNEMFKQIDCEYWIDGEGIRYKENEINLRSKDFKTFGEFCNVKIGLVPGATSFFVHRKDELSVKNIQETDCARIVTSGADLTQFDIHQDDLLKRILIINEKNEERYCDLIRDGEKREFNKRSHCKLRNKWYSINIPKKIPDAFFTYRASEVPLMALNTLGVWCTNAVHAIFLKKGTSIEMLKWIQISLLSLISLIELETRGRTYGKDVLKIEPSALKNVRVYCPKNKKMSNDLWKRICHFVVSGRRDEASVFATRYIFGQLRLSRKKQKAIVDYYCELREKRTGNTDHWHFFRAIYERQEVKEPASPVED